MLTRTYFAVSAVFSGFTSAYPALPKQAVLTVSESAAACHQVSQYTTEWFLANTLPDYRKEVHNKALFYTRGTSHAAQDLAHKHPEQYTTIWEVWPCYLYDDRQVDSNPLRCIHDDHDNRRTFYENMSRAFARMSRESTTIMHSVADYENVPQDGIWARVELPTLRDGTDVVQLEKIRADGGASRSYMMTRDAWDTVKAAIMRAIEEVRAIFRSAKSSQFTADSGACTIWSSQDDGFLESLW